TDPAVAFLKGPVAYHLRDCSNRALHDVLSVKDANQVSKATGANFHATKSARGLIGALAVIGAKLDQVRHTFEVIVYRTKDSLGTKRAVDKESVFDMDTKYNDSTFQNLDRENGRVLICLHGPDPVLLGIRGFDPFILLNAMGVVRESGPLGT